VQAYKELAGLGESVAQQFVRDARSRRFDSASKLLDRDLSAAALQSWFASLERDVGGIRATEVVWRNAMTFPDPKDPNEYMTVILRVNGDGRQTSLIFYLRGLRNQLRIFYMTGMGYDYIAGRADARPDNQALPR
jgi:hypothetical protein